MKAGQIKKASKSMIALVVATSFTLTGCETMPLAMGSGQDGGGGQGSAPAVGPLAGVNLNEHANGSSGDAVQPVSQVYLDVVIPEFDDGLPKIKGTNEINYKKLDSSEGIRPQLRRAESKKFAVKTRKALQELGVFGSVSVVPSRDVPGELVVLGKIVESNGRDIKLNIEVYGGDGKRLNNKTFEYSVPKSYMSDQVNSGKNTYEPVFNEIAQFVAAQLRNLDTPKRNELKTINQVAYAAKYSPQKYMGMLSINRDRTVSLKSLPDESDILFKQIEAVRNQENGFVDGLQASYEKFDASTEVTYQEWQRSVHAMIKEEESQTGRQIAGTLGALASAGLAIWANKKGHDVVRDAAVVGAVGGVAVAYDASKRKDEQKKLIDEMSTSVDAAISPTQISFEGQKAVLTGTAQQQYKQLRTHLAKMHEVMSGSNKNLATFSR